MDSSEKAPTTSSPHDSPVLRGIMIAIFWEYNGFYVLYLLSQVIGFLRTGELSPVLTDIEPWYKAVFVVLIGLIPLFSIILSFKNHLYRKGSELAKLFFLFEIPAVLLSLFLFTFSSQTLPIFWVIIITLYLCPFIYIYRLIRPSDSSPAAKMTLMFLYQSIAMIVAYFIFLFSFYSPVFIASLIKLLFEIFTGDSYSFYYTDLPARLIFGLIGVTIAMFLIAVPYVLTYFLVKLFLSARRSVEAVWGNTRVTLYNTIFGATLVAIVLIFSLQPNLNHYVVRLNKLQAALTFDEKEMIVRGLMPHRKEIKRALEEAYSPHSRYLFTENDDSLSYLYEDALGFDPTLSQTIQSIFLEFAYPFVYHGQVTSSSSISQYYESLFGDHPYSSRLYRDPEPVRITKRTIQARTDYNDLLATITIETEFTNSATWQQEVVYDLSLPAEATITDLKLGLNLEFNGIIAPRGAAATTYQQEVNRRIDPALLEQTGPRQYTLRIFPIPPKVRSGPENRQKISFTYVTGAYHGGYPLPVFKERSNVVAEHAPRYAAELNGKPAVISKENDMIESALAKGALERICTSSAQITSKTQSGGHLQPHSALGGCDEAYLPDLSKHIKGKNIAILYDVSYKNKDKKFPEDVRKTLLKSSLLEGNRVDLYLYNNTLSKPISLTPEVLQKPFDFAYFGANDWQTLIRTFDPPYDMTFVIAPSEEKIYDYQERGLATAAVNRHTPLYIMHTGGTIPPYDQPVINNIYNFKGQVVNSLQEAVNHYAVSHVLSQNPSANSITTGPYWSVSPGSYNPVSGAAFSDPVNALAARAFYMNGIFAYKMPPPNGVLDTFMPVAEKNHIVTPYTSLIALVNEAQLQSLNINSQSYNRYDATSTGLGGSQFSGPASNTIRVNERALGFSMPSYTGPIIAGAAFILINIVTLVIVGVVVMIRKRKQAPTQ